jgi:large subunit ribosomal protein L4
MAETTKTTKSTLPNEVFAVEVPNHELLKRAYNSYLANSRSASPRTKTRGLVSGGGKKPWRQKGTGRARVGSIRSPIWRGGGIVFGPMGNENHTIRLSKTSKHVALRQALTLAAKAGKVTVKDIKTTGKTKEVASFLNTNKFIGSVLMVVDDKTPELIRATNNLENVELVRSTYLSVFRILNADAIVITPTALKAITEWLADGSSRQAGEV